MVYIDGVKIDKTPISSFYPAGTYKIKLTSDNYEDIDETIVIKGPETKKTYQLTDIRATLTINTHEKARVYINGEQVSNYKNMKLSPQVVNVKVEMNKAKTLEERIILGKKDNKTLDMMPQISTGTIQVAVIPNDAELELYEDGGEKYTSTGSKSFSNVPVGTYKLKVSKKGFITHTEDIRLTADAIERKSIKLEIEENIPKEVQGKMVIVMNLYNRNLERAKEELKRNNLVLGKVNIVTDIDKAFGRIIGQSIPWGTKVEEGTVIDIDLNSGSLEESIGR